MAGAWSAGTRNVRELARLAGVTRDTIYSDLRRRGIDPADRTSLPPLPAYAPLNAAVLRELAVQVGATAGPAVLTDFSEPLAQAAFATHMALDHISALAGPMGEDAELRPARVEDLAFQGDPLRRQAHALWAAVEDTQVVVARTAQRRAEMADEEASVESAELTVRCRRCPWWSRSSR